MCDAEKWLSCSRSIWQGLIDPFPCIINLNAAQNSSPQKHHPSLASVLSPQEAQDGEEIHMLDCPELSNRQTIPWESDTKWAYCYTITISWLQLDQPHCFARSYLSPAAYEPPIPHCPTRNAWIIMSQKNMDGDIANPTDNRTQGCQDDICPISINV